MASKRPDTARIIPTCQDHPTLPTSERDFHIALFCALVLEADAVIALFDLYCDVDRIVHTRSPGDPNAYTTGIIGKHNVVLVHMAGMGRVEAASAAAHCRATFPDIKLAIIVGVCGVIPCTPNNQEIILGDVIISEGVVQYDLGRLLPEGFVRKKTLQESLGRQNPQIRSQLAKLKGIENRKIFKIKIMEYLAAIQRNDLLAAQYPGAQNDRLFEPDYRHIRDGELCDKCGCNGPQIPRDRLKQEGGQYPVFHLGLVASADIVLKSGKDRDILAKEESVIAFEMEAAGVWEILPCVVIKSACDYADSHKMKAWQRYAAATAAACSKAFLDLWPSYNLSGPQYYIPLLQNRKFTGRADILEHVQKKLFIDKDCQNLAIVGLGGIGKTQVALQLAYWVKENQPTFSVFWLPVISHASFEQAFLEIGRKLQVRMDVNNEDPKVLVQRYLCSEQAGKWLLIIDNADDINILSGSRRNLESIDQYLPHSEHGLTLFTSRSSDVGQSVAGSDVIMLSGMDQSEAMGLLEKSIVRKELVKENSTALKLLEKLEWLPLAITQAAACLNRNRQISIRRYLELLGNTEFQDDTKDRDSRDAVATTWFVSFNQIQIIDNAAATLLSFLSCIEPKAIPHFLLPKPESEETQKAIGTLCGYAFLTMQKDDEIYEMHTLVHSAIKLWNGKTLQKKEITLNALRHFKGVFEGLNKDGNYVWKRLFPHAFRILDGSKDYWVQERFDLLYQVGGYLLEDRRFREAIRCYEEHCAWQTATVGDTHPHLAESECLLARAYLGNRETPKAIKILERVVTTACQTGKSRLESQNQLSQAYVRDGWPQKAIKLSEQTLVMARETLDQKDRDRLSIERALADAYLHDKRIKKGIEILEHVAAVANETLDERDPDRLEIGNQLADAYLQDKRTRNAIEILERAVAVAKKAFNETNHRPLLLQHSLARAYVQDGRLQEGIGIWEHIVAVGKETLDERDLNILAMEQELAMAYFLAQRFQEAIGILEHVVRVQKEFLDKMHLRRHTSESLLAQAYLVVGRFKDFVRLFQQLAEVEADILFRRHDSTSELARAYRAHVGILQAVFTVVFAAFLNLWNWD